MKISIRSVVFCFLSLSIGFIGFFIEQIMLIEFSILLLYLFSLVSSYCYFNRVNVVFIYVVALGLFILSRLFAHLFFGYDWFSGYMYIDYAFDLGLQLELLMVILFFCFGLSLSLCGKPKIFVILDGFDKKQKDFQKISSLFMMVSFFPLVYRKVLEYKLMAGHAYSDMYLTNDLFQSLPIYLRGWNMLFEFSFYIFIASRPKKSRFVFFSILYLMIGALTALKGARGDFVISLFVCMAFYSYYYGLKFSLKIVLIFALVGVFSQFISLMRSGLELEFNVFKIMFDFVIEQGGSINVIAYNLLYAESYHNDAFYTIFSPIIDGVLSRVFPSNFSGMTETLIENSYGLGVQLPAVLNREFFLKGFGTGGSSIAEFYNVGGLFAVFLLSFILVKMSMIFDCSRNAPIFLMFLFIPFIQNLFFSPRGSAIPGVVDIVTFLYVYIFFWVLLVFLRCVKRNGIDKNKYDLVKYI